MSTDFEFFVCNERFLTLHLAGKRSGRVREHMDYRNRQYNHIGLHESKGLTCKITKMGKDKGKIGDGRSFVP